jgi:hypothetical protein
LKNLSKELGAMLYFDSNSDAGITTGSIFFQINEKLNGKVIMIIKQ